MQKYNNLKIITKMVNSKTRTEAEFTIKALQLLFLIPLK